MNIDNLKKAREAAQLTQAQAAKKLDISDGAYKNYEQGKREPNNTLLGKIADLYGVSTDYLLGRNTTAEEPLDTLARQNGMPGKEKAALAKWLELDAEKRDIVLQIMKEVIQEYERAGTQKSIRHMVQMRCSKHKVSAGVGYDLNDSDLWKRLNVLDCESVQEADFIVQVDGDSMHPKYKDGEYVFVALDPDVQIGKDGIFIVDGAGYIKQRGNGILISLNPEYDDIQLEGTDNLCVGRVLGVAELPE